MISAISIKIIGYNTLSLTLQEAKPSCAAHAIDSIAINRIEEGIG